MATVVPPPSKKARKQAQQIRDVDLVPDDVPQVLIKFQAADTGDALDGSIRVPGGITEQQLEELLNQLKKEDEPVPYSFSLLNGASLVDIQNNLYTSVLKPGIKSSEDTMTIVYTPRAVFKVRPVTNLSTAISGHGSTILCCLFAPNNSGRMCSGAGDSTARIWDCYTNTPYKTLAGHLNWVLCVSYSPCGSMVATGLMDNTARLWDAESGAQLGGALAGHAKWISSLLWEPLHLVKAGQLPRLATGSKDGTVKVWNTALRQCEMTLSGHTNAVLCVRWLGLNILYSGSHDKSIKCWDMAARGQCMQTLVSHAHWINHLSLLTDHVLRRGAFDHTGKKLSPAEMRGMAQAEYEKVARLGGEVRERLVSASDDFTIFLWEPLKATKPICRMTGHQKLVNHVLFSPDGRYVVLASFDNSVKLWDGIKGTFLGTFRGHVAPVYQTAWSLDSRLLVSCSKDTTLKVWDVKTRKIKVDLPGHKDEVYAVDWSVDGTKVASGGKDKTVRIWLA